MSWAAANLPRRQENNEDAPAKSKESKRRGETVEAVLSRLSKSYSLAMECLGAMHEANAAIVKRKPEDIDDASLQSLRKVAVAARNMLERTILIDPLIVEHSPCLRNTIRQFADNKGPTSEKWKALCAPRPEPPKISSKAHRATIQQLAYLSLTNYADLLVSCCTCCCGRIDHAKNSDKLLDRGVVKKLQGFSDNFAKMGCCWEDDEADIQRLALVAMSDASALDGSDPVVWLKLACAARAMGHLNALPDRLVNPMLSPFRRLERHALEKGYTALPPNVPPNRIISRLLNEFNNEQPPDLYPAVLVEQQDPVKLRLDLTRYSWASLGRLLMKACREGKAMEGDDTLHMNAIKNARIFPSPVISLNLSPMLLIPSNVLSVLLSFLENNSVWKLEATCRALSVSIMSVRAAIEKQGASTSKTQQGEPSTSGKPNVDQNNEEMPSNSQPAANNETDQGESGRGREEPSQQGGETSTRVGRSSKRVRSQQLSSDKKEERLRRRNSVEFCLRAATLSCTSSDEQYNASLKVPEAWDSFKGEVWKLPASLEGPSVSQKGKIQSLEESRKKSEASERTGPSSLSSFLVTWNSSNTGPIDMLLQYLGHVAVHVENVFLVDPADAMALTSCISGCKLFIY